MRSSAATGNTSAVAVRRSRHKEAALAHREAAAPRRTTPSFAILHDNALNPLPRRRPSTGTPVAGAANGAARARARERARKHERGARAHAHSRARGRVRVRLCARLCGEDEDNADKFVAAARAEIENGEA
eukprot:2973472-Pleurochrysis_carterae.AAC.1